MALSRLVAVVTVLGLVSTATAGSACESNSVLFGSPWAPHNPFYIQESAWNNYGNITKVNLYVDPNSGCVTGVKATYGWDAANARRLGIEKMHDENLPSKDLKLQKGEYFNKAEYKFGRCITYLSLRTNQGRSVAIGDISSSGPLQTSQPEWPDGFLAYFKAYTDVPNISAQIGKLEQLQLVWASRTCGVIQKVQGNVISDRDPAVQRMTAALQAAAADDASDQASGVAVQVVGSTSATVLPSGEPAIAADQTLDAEAVQIADVIPGPGSVAITSTPTTASSVTPEPVTVAGPSAKLPRSIFVGPLRKPVPNAASSQTVVNTTTIITTTTSEKKPADGTGTYITTTTTTTTTSTTAVCKPTRMCSEGMCTTSSCALNGLGQDAAGMMCFGTNIVPNPLLDLTTGNPCTNLACKLDRQSCSSSETGKTGFCTGKVVPMGATAKLHASGKAYLGYPCIEHRVPLFEFIQIGDYSAQGTYVPRAWKVCDCVDRFLSKDGGDPFKMGGGIPFKAPVGGSFVPPKFPTIPHFPFLNRPLINMSLPDVVAQWVAANLADAPVPLMPIDQSASQQLKSMLPNFTIPSVVVPKISVPLLKLPKKFDYPLFVLPVGNKTIHKVTSAIPDITSLPTLVVPRDPPPQLTVKAPSFHLPQITIDNLSEWADSFGVPSMPKLPPIFKMTFQDVLTQWVVANQFSMPIPIITLPDNHIESLKAILPNFQAPALVVVNISTPLLNIPQPFPVPVVSIPEVESTVKKVEQFLPRISSLPAFVAPSTWPPGVPNFPDLLLHNVTIPNIAEVAIEAGAAPPKWFNFPKLNFTVPKPNVHPVNFSLPGVFLTAKLPGDLSLPKPNLGPITAALDNLQPRPLVNFGVNLTQWPKLPDPWNNQHIPKPFDLSAFTKMATSNGQNDTNGVEVSFEVPNVMAQWIAGVIKNASVPQVHVQDEVITKLQEVLPELPQLPAVVVVNVSAPYYSSDALKLPALPTVIIPDALVPSITNLLPDLALTPLMLVPKSAQPQFQLQLPEISLETLAAPSFLTTVANIMAGLETKAGGSSVTDQILVSLAPAPPAAAAAPVPTDTSGSSSSSSSNSMSVPVAAVQSEPVVTEVPTDDSAALAADLQDEDGVPAAMPATAAAVPVQTAAAPASTNVPGSTAQQTAAVPTTVVDDNADEPVVTEAPQSTDSVDSEATDNPESGSLQPSKQQKDQEQQVQPVRGVLSYTEDADGDLIIQGAGPETAYMDPAEFYALDKATQQQFLAIMGV